MDSACSGFAGVRPAAPAHPQSDAESPEESLPRARNVVPSAQATGRRQPPAGPGLGAGGDTALPDMRASCMLPAQTLRKSASRTAPDTQHLIHKRTEQKANGFLGNARANWTE